jgi:hypothetical protein
MRESAASEPDASSALDRIDVHRHTALRVVENLFWLPSPIIFKGRESGGVGRKTRGGHGYVLHSVM